MKTKSILSTLLCVIILLISVNECLAYEINGSNIVLNGGFESGSANWKNWEGNCALATETFHSGKNSIKLWADTTGQNEQFLQDVKVKPGATYKFETWVRVPSGQSAKVSLLLSDTGYSQTNLGSILAEYNASERDPSFTPNKVNGDAGDGHTIWKKLEKTIVIPDETNFPSYNSTDIATYPTLCIYFQYTSGGNWNRYLYIDDVNLTKVYTRENIVNSVEITQNGSNVQEVGYTTGVVLATINVDEDVKINGSYPYAVIAVYDGDELLSINFDTVTNNISSDGTVSITIGTTISTKMIGQNCRIEVFLWSSMEDMMSLSSTYAASAR